MAKSQLAGDLRAQPSEKWKASGAKIPGGARSGPAAPGFPSLQSRRGGGGFGGGFPPWAGGF